MQAKGLNILFLKSNCFVSFLFKYVETKRILLNCESCLKKFYNISSGLLFVLQTIELCDYTNFKCQYFPQTEVKSKAPSNQFLKVWLKISEKALQNIASADFTRACNSWPGLWTGCWRHYENGRATERFTFVVNYRISN